MAAPRRWKTCWSSWSQSHSVARHQPTQVACPVAAVAKPPPPMPVASPGAAAAKLVLPRKRERVPEDVDCVACWNLSRGCTAGKAHALTCYRSKSARPHERAHGKSQAMLKADAKETETEGASEGTEWASQPRCCSAVKKSQCAHPAPPLLLMFFLHGSACPLHSQWSSDLIRAWWGREGRGGGQRRAGQGQGKSRTRQPTRHANPSATRHPPHARHTPPATPLAPRRHAAHTSHAAHTHTPHIHTPPTHTLLKKKKRKNDTKKKTKKRRKTVKKVEKILEKFKISLKKENLGKQPWTYVNLW